VKIPEPYHTVGVDAVADHDTGRQRAGDEKHGQEQQAAAEKHGGEEAVLEGAQAIPQYTDEPEEGDAGEGEQVKCEVDRPAVTLQPGSGLLRVGGYGPINQHQAGDVEDGKYDAGKRGGAWRRQAGVDQSVVRIRWAHRGY
jgi:hypothetical protein